MYQDDCARAVTGTFRAATSTHHVDCSSFQQCTVTPAESTITETATVTPSLLYSTVTATTVPFVTTIETITQPASTTLVSSPYPVFKRSPAALEHWLNPPQEVLQAAVTSATATTNCPTNVPSYASACSGTVKYQSACSCWGLTKSTTTLPTPSTTITTTETLATPVTTILATATTDMYVVDTTTFGTLTIETDYPVCTTAPKQTIGPNYCECRYTETCGENSAAACKYPVDAASYFDCLNMCDFYVDCLGFNFNYKAGTCTLCDRNATVTNINGSGTTANGMRNQVACGGSGGYQCYTS